MKKTLVGAALVAILPAVPAAASPCAALGGETVFHCPIDKSSREVTICKFANASFNYRYGKPGQKPELELTRARDEVRYRPDNGIGRFIFESVEFDNKGYRYQVAVSIDKQENTLEGYLNVFEPGADEPSFSRACRQDKVDAELFQLGDDG